MAGACNFAKVSTCFFMFLLYFAYGVTSVVFIAHANLVSFGCGPDVARVSSAVSGVGEPHTACLRLA